MDLGFSRQTQEEVMNQELKYNGDFPGGPVVKIVPSNTGVRILSLAEEPHASSPKNKIKQNLRQKRCCDKLNKEL